MSLSIGQRTILTAYQASPLWALTPPGDWQSYTGSTAWSALATALSTALGIAPDVPSRRGCYAQLVALLRQTLGQSDAARNINSTDRGALRQFCSELIRVYEPSTQP